MAGVIPISLALTYFGEQALSLDWRLTLLVGILIGTVTLLPLAARIVWKRYQKRTDGEAATSRNVSGGARN